MAKKDDHSPHVHIESLNGNYVDSVDGHGQVSRDHYHNSPNNQRDEITQIFQPIIAKAEALPKGSDRDDALEAASKLEAEVRKGEQAEEKRVRRSLDTLLDTAPDAWEVAVTTLANPIAGIGTVIRKIVERAKQERTA